MALTPMQEQYLALKKRYPNEILLYRLGDFYEAFNEDAKKISRILNITLTGRGKDDNRIPMAGIPYHALDNYLPKLIGYGLDVAIAEQVTDPKAGTLVDREVLKVYTPGTYITPTSSENQKNNYLCCLYSTDNKSIYLAFLDISTGELFVIETYTQQDLQNYLDSYSPLELLISEKDKLIELKKFNSIKKIINSDEFEINSASKLLLRHFRTNSLKGYGFSSSDKSLIPISVLLRYAKENQKTELEHITSLKKLNLSDYMKLDSSTIRNLELVENIRNDGEPLSLFEVLNSCVTSMGKRLLRQWILNPLINILMIQERLDIVEVFYNNKKLTYEIVEYLSSVYDIERMLAKVGTGSVNGRDLLSLKESLASISLVHNLLKQNFSQEKNINKFLSVLDPDYYTEVINLINKGISDDCPIKFENGGIIKNGYCSEIDELRNIKTEGKNFILNLQDKERKRSGIDNLKIKFNNVFGYFIEVSKSNSNRVPDDFIRKQTLVNAERYVTEELKIFEEKILSADEKLLELENENFNMIVSDIIKYIIPLQDISKMVGLLDLYTNFAHLAIKRNYVKPEVHDDLERHLSFKGSRHPIIEIIKKEEYIPNDIELFENKNMVVLTGPNMSGKSTYIRQIALITLMAQIGCFVPCDTCNLSIVDRIFTRVGASDNLSAGESTFMVEMLETSNILNNATHKSLIILDEVGRGTSTYDGVAIAWSIVEFLYKKFNAFTLFATHYHELINLSNKFNNIRNFHVHVDEIDDKIYFTRKIKEGGISKSYGIHVAELAGMPSEVVANSTKLLKSFELNQSGISNKSKKIKIVPETNPQIKIF